MCELQLTIVGKCINFKTFLLLKKSNIRISISSNFSLVLLICVAKYLNDKKLFTTRKRLKKLGLLDHK